MKLAHISCKPSSGLSKLVSSLEMLLIKSNFVVSLIDPEIPSGSCDLCIHMEKVSPVNIKLASHNALVPMPEHVLSFDYYDKLDSVLCVNKYGFDLFREIEHKFNYQTLFIGCTTLIDKPFKLYAKDYEQAIHFAGTSPWKNTNLVLQTWKNNPNLPKLNVTCLDRSEYRSCFREHSKLIGECVSCKNIEIHTKPLARDKISELQSLAGLSICPSEAEGYSNYINESLYFGSIVLTLDYPPMNELVDSDCGIIIKSKHTRHHNKLNVSCRSFSQSELVNGVNEYLSLSYDQKLERSVKSHTIYQRNQSFFLNSFKQFLNHV